DACLAAIRLAMAYRAEYHDDVVIDLVGYRRHGHNETDEPGYTQPRAYSRIAEHPTVRTLWAERLIEEGVIDEAQAKAMEEAVSTALRAAKDELEAIAAEPDALDQGTYHEPEVAAAPEVVTRVPLATLTELNQAALAWPDDFDVHP